VVALRRSAVVGFAVALQLLQKARSNDPFLSGAAAAMAAASIAKQRKGLRRQ
jgi:hypothetical protein